MNRVDISVVMTCYKEGELLRRAYSSLEAQTDRDFEVVIVNDASQDDFTNAVCRELETQRQAKLIWRAKNGGLAVARNHGIDVMKGEICVLLDGDDILLPDAVATVREAFQRVPEAAFVFGDYIRRELRTDSEQVVDCSILCGSDGFIDPRILANKWILLGTSPYRKSVWRSTGGYSKLFAYYSDVDFFMRLMERGLKGLYVGKTIYVWNRSPAGMNSTAPADAGARILLAHWDFYDKFGGGIKRRKEYLDLMFGKIADGDFSDAHSMARQLLRRRCFSLKVTVLAVCPVSLTPHLYALFKLVRKMCHILLREHDVQDTPSV